jgi:hypothetical protein
VELELLAGEPAARGAAFLAAVEAALLWELRFFFLVLVVGVPGKSAPVSITANKRLEMRRMVI